MPATLQYRYVPELNHSDQLRVVLVNPRNPLNIGAVARAMANFGFRDLAVVSPWEASWREARSAVGAPELLRNAPQYMSLSEAVADCTLVLGTGSLTYRKPEQPVVSLPDLGPLAAKEAHAGGRIALVFGSEKHGMTREDLSWCHRLVVIPTADEQPSMNLGQAAAVCLYELATRSPLGHTSEVNICAERSAATSADLAILARLVEESMELAGYSPRSMQAANQHDLRLMLRRMSLSPLDLRRSLGLFRRILWRLRRIPLSDSANIDSKTGNS